MRFVLGLVGGLVVGLAMTACLAVQPFSTWIDTQPIASVYGAIHYPADVFCGWWWNQRLPPHGDAGFAMIPISVFAQWVALGLIVGIVLQVRSVVKRMKRNRHSADTERTAGSE